jgi:LDH2 family malate/lactate/ureidoglycolate dehydrogenase
VLVPGEPEQRSAAGRAAGIPLDAATWDQLTTAAAALRVDVPADSIT